MLSMRRHLGKDTGLDSFIEQVVEVEKNTVFRIISSDNQQSFFICLDEKLCQEELNKLKLTTDDLFVCRDQALGRYKSGKLSSPVSIKNHLSFGGLLNERKYSES